MTRFQKSASLIALCWAIGAASGASAQQVQLNPGQATTTQTGTTGPNGQPSPFTTVDPQTNVSTSQTYVNRLVVTPYTKTLNQTFSLYGQTVTDNLNAAANVGQNQRSTTTTTSTPNGLGGFTVSQPVTTTANFGNPVVSGFQVSETLSSPITGFYKLNTTTTQSNGNALTVSTTSGDVSASGIEYAVSTGTATFDASTGLLTASNPTYTSRTNIGSNGLTTTGSVNTNTLNATGMSVLNGIDNGGKAITNIANGTNATDAANVGQVSAAVAAEATRATAAETALDTRVTKNTSDIAANTTAIAAEATRATAAETALNTRVTKNTSDITANAAAIVAEANRATAAEGALDTRVTKNTGDITANAAAIVAEATRATAAENALGARVTAETSRALAAETQLSNKIDAETSRAQGAEKQLDLRINASTAMAAALGGGMFLPNTHFNLSANVATYKGATAAAVQGAYIVSPHVALTAGASFMINAGGANNNGTLGRVGVTVGW
ncbi:MAG: hypothetical protein WCO11_08020 [Sphingomonadales bacterium]|jgi:hypothetical protein